MYVKESKKTDNQENTTSKKNENREDDQVHNDDGSEDNVEGELDLIEQRIGRIDRVIHTLAKALNQK
jgi:hypothetical protein